MCLYVGSSRYFLPFVSFFYKQWLVVLRLSRNHKNGYKNYVSTTQEVRGERILRSISTFSLSLVACPCRGKDREICLHKTNYTRGWMKRFPQFIHTHLCICACYKYVSWEMGFSKYIDSGGPTSVNHGPLHRSERFFLLLFLIF